ncbi:hypothetical protein [Alcanivorax sp.]|nr:hypothetical protein [Alcanivorax sp.]
MSQLTFAEAEYEHKKRKTRREVFLVNRHQFARHLSAIQNGNQRGIYE